MPEARHMSNLAWGQKEEVLVNKEPSEWAEFLFLVHPVAVL